MGCPSTLTPAIADVERELDDAENEYRESFNARATEDMKETNPKDVVGAGKVPLELCPDTLPTAVSMAFLEGALKYGRYNWRVAGVRSSIYAAAARRHMASWWNGEDVDPDSGLPHLWKAAACLAVLIDAEQIGKLTDDRPPRAPVAIMLRALEGNVQAMKDRYGDRSPKQYTIADGRPE